MKQLAQAAHNLGQIGGEGLGPFGSVSDATSGLTGITKMVSSVIGIITVAAGIWFLLQFTIGGFGWITSGGDKAKLQSSRDKITNAIVGLIIVSSVWAVMTLVGQFVGIDFPNLPIPTVQN